MPVPRDVSHRPLFDTDITTPALEGHRFQSVLNLSTAVDEATTWTDLSVSSVSMRADGLDHTSPARVIAHHSSCYGAGVTRKAPVGIHILKTLHSISLYDRMGLMRLISVIWPWWFILPDSAALRWTVWMWRSRVLQNFIPWESMFTKRSRRRIVFQLIPVNNGPHEQRMSIGLWLSLRWRYPKTCAVVGNLRIKDVAGDVVLESSRMYCTLRPLWY